MILLLLFALLLVSYALADGCKSSTFHYPANASPQPGPPLFLSGFPPRPSSRGHPAACTARFLTLLASTLSLRCTSKGSSDHAQPATILQQPYNIYGAARCQAAKHLFHSSRCQKVLSPSIQRACCTISEPGRATLHLGGSQRSQCESDGHCRFFHWCAACVWGQSVLP